MLGDVPWAIYRYVCYCVRPCERHKEPEQATMVPVVAPGSLRGKLKKMWPKYKELWEERVSSGGNELHECGHVFTYSVNVLSQIIYFLS